ncbi:MAG: methionine gamma-lyase [Candidatus Microgenomates bacterium]
MKLASKNIHLGIKELDPVFGSVIPPIFPTSTYIFKNAKQGADRFSGKEKGMIYSRFTNPTVDLLAKRLAALEEAEMALITSSGMAAISLTLFHLLKKDDHILAHKVVYGGTFEFISRILPRYGIEVDFVDFKNKKEILSKIKNNTKILYFESPTNPLLEIIDIEKIVKIAKTKKLITIFDNTFAPPPLQYPIKLGIDIVIHSLTKYIGGHSDLIGGAIVGKKTFLEPLFLKSYIFFGPTMSPFSAYLALRGLSTLEVRIKKQSENALKIAKFLQNHPKIEKVFYPGISSHPDYNLAKKQMFDFGGVLSFIVKGGYKKAEKLVNNVKLINLAVSLGAVESLIEHPASMTHSELTPEERKKAGIDEGLIRLSVGLEDVDDLINDLKQSLK